MVSYPKQFGQQAQLPQSNEASIKLAGYKALAEGIMEAGKTIGDLAKESRELAIRKNLAQADIRSKIAILDTPEAMLQTKQRHYLDLSNPDAPALGSQPLKPDEIEMLTAEAARPLAAALGQMTDIMDVPVPGIGNIPMHMKRFKPDQAESMARMMVTSPIGAQIGRTAMREDAIGDRQMAVAEKKAEAAKSVAGAKTATAKDLEEFRANLKKELQEDQQAFKSSESEKEREFKGAQAEKERALKKDLSERSLAVRIDVASLYAQGKAEEALANLKENMIFINMDRKQRGEDATTAEEEYQSIVKTAERIRASGKKKKEESPEEKKARLKSLLGD